MKKVKFSFVKLIWALFLLPIFFILLMLIIAVFSDLPTFEQLENPRSIEASVVYSQDGEIIGKYYSENRVKVSYHELSPYLEQALVSTEDERFEKHSGVDANAIGRAIFGALTFNSKGGGSTITQQLAKMMFHEPPQTKFGRIRQKFSEWIISAKLEKQYTKSELIAMYLNKFDFLYNAVGIQSAAEIYFNTTPKELTIQESALLVGMAKNPIIYNPVINPDNAFKRRMVVLKQMQKNGKITQDEYDSLRVLPLGLDFRPESQNTGVAPYFRAWLKDEAEQLLKEKEITKPDGSYYSTRWDGLKIYTTIDSRMQAYAEAAVEAHLAELQEQLDKDIENNKNYPYSNATSKQQVDRFIWNEIRKTSRYKTYVEQGLSDEEILEQFKQPIKMDIFDWKGYNHSKYQVMSPYDSILYTQKILRTGVVSIEPQTGFIKVWVGGPNYKNFKYDYAASAQRQVGSTIKPFVYAVAMRDGVADPCTEFADIEYCIDVNKNGSMEPWCPSDKYDAEMTPVYCALAGSKNNITAKLIKMSGGNNRQVVDLFSSMGIRNSSIKPVPALGLGVCEMTVLDLTSAQTIFVNHGVYVKPNAILRIEDRYGKVLYESRTKVREVLDSKSSFQVLKMLKGTMKGAIRPADGKVFGTATSIGKYLSFQCAGKTGTTQNSSDGWFVGYTPDLVTGVWVGCDNPNIRFRSSYYGQGSRMAAPIWNNFIRKVYSNRAIKINRGDFIPPAGDSTTFIFCQPKDTSNMEVF